MIEFDSKHLLEHFDKTCRFCLSHEGCVNILCEDGIMNEILIKAADFIVSKVDPNDGLPNSICQKCIKCMDEFAVFEENCQEAYEILHQIIVLDLDRTDNLELILADDNSASNDTPEETQNDFQDNEIVEEKLIPTRFETAINAQSSPSNNPDHADIFNAIEQPHVTAKKGKICPICGKFVSQLSKHLPTHSTIKRHACSHCTKKFSHDTTLRKHIRSVHLKIKNYQCESCSESFTDRSSLRYHDIVKHKDAKNFACAVCNKSYYTSTGLQQHNSLTHEQRKFKCDECGKMFAMKYHLKEHEKTHSDERPYACTFCDRTFKRIKNLNEHLTVHKEAK